MRSIIKRRFIALVVGTLIVWAASAGISCKPGSDNDEGNHAEHGRPATSEDLSGSVQDGVRVIQITASRFKFEPNRVVVAQGEKVRLEVTSTDVPHGIMIHEMNIERRLEPNKTEAVDLTADKAGTFHFHCSVWCGEGHDRMHGELVVLPKSVGG
jgi:heme/copper-type cytochrome/quinol oxidase subunit 2